MRVFKTIKVCSVFALATTEQIVQASISSSASKKSLPLRRSRSPSRTRKGAKRSKTSQSNKMQNDENDNDDGIGGGAVNEKKRLYGIPTSAKGCVTAQTESQKENSQGSATLGSKDASNFNSNQHLAHALHALMGLDRYPNYLHRWSSYEKDLDQLEQSLLDTLNKVRQQRQSLHEKEQLMNRVARKVHKKALDEKAGEENENTSNLAFPFRSPTSWKELRQSKMLHPQAAKVLFGSLSRSKKQPAFEDVLSGTIHINLDEGLLEEWVEEEMDNVYSCQLFSKEFCATMTKIIKSTAHQLALEEEEEGEKPGGYKYFRRPLDLDLLGFRWLNDLVFHLWVRPLSKALYGIMELNLEGDKHDMKHDLDWRQGYVAGYASENQLHKTRSKTSASASQYQVSSSSVLTRSRLVSHTDDSEVTCNICLGDPDFKGGELAFHGLRGSNEEGDETGTYQPKIGRALLHVGRHLHQVTEVCKGERYAYILWARSWGGVRATACPCCWLTRRSGDRCICDPVWN